ncbi:hypothetical protein [Brevibacillus porteri]
MGHKDNNEAKQIRQVELILEDAIEALREALQRLREIRNDLDD